MSRLNVIEIVWHDLGDWLSCYGRPDVPSPCLDRFAGESVVFENHFCTAPQCCPSRATIKTGRYPQSHGVMGLTHRGWRYRNGEQDLPAILNRAGYRTCLFGCQHERDNAAELTYAESWTETAGGDPVADRVVGFLNGAARSAQPFFASVGFNEVHRRYGMDYDPAVAERLTVPGFLPDVPVVRKDMAAFYHRIRQADAAAGRILEAVRVSGLASSTLVLFTTDHGPEFPRAKMTLYDPGLKVALIVRHPHLSGRGARVPRLTSHVDVLPTILNLAGVAVPANVQGASMAGLLEGRTVEHRPAAFAQMTWHAGEYDPMRSIRTSRHKYIRNFMPGWPSQMGGPYTERYGTEFINRHFGQPRPAEELYDLVADPWEQRDLASDPANAALRGEMAARLQAWMGEVNDPILQGPVPAADPSKVGYDCVWGKFPTRCPEKQEFRFSIVRTKDYGELPL